MSHTKDPSYALRRAAEYSTCRKRVVICALYDATGTLLAVGWNSCEPKDGKCVRLGTVQQQAGYTGTECNSVHAEEQALKNLPADAKPFRAVAYGHDFMCDDCQEKLRERGVQFLLCCPEGYGSGLREKTKLTLLPCDICGGVPGLVAASAMGPLSYAICPACARAHREKYEVLVAGLMTAGSDPAGWAPWVMGIVEPTLAFYGKTMADLKKDIDEAWAEYEAEMQKLVAGSNDPMTLDVVASMP